MIIIKLAENVEVIHPYEPVLCKNVDADIIAFYYDDYAEHVDIWKAFTKMLCTMSYRCVFVDESIKEGCLIAYRYFDESLSCAHDIYKPFFEAYDQLELYKSIFIDWKG